MKLGFRHIPPSGNHTCTQVNEVDLTIQRGILSCAREIKTNNPRSSKQNDTIWALNGQNVSIGITVIYKSLKGSQQTQKGGNNDSCSQSHLVATKI